MSEFWSVSKSQKCEIFWPSVNQTFPEIDSDVRRVHTSVYGGELLGSPIVGPEDFFIKYFCSRVDKVLEAQSILPELENLQVASHLLWSYLCVCKLNHLLQTIPGHTIIEQLSRFDSGMRHSLCQITNSSISDPAWMQATLPLRFGNLGLRSASESSPAAFLGSCNATRDLVQRLLEAESSRNVSTWDSMNLCTTQSSFSQTLTLPGEIKERERFSAQLENHIGTDEPAFFTSPQKALQSQLDVIHFQSLKDMSSVRDTARLITIPSAYAGAWLRAIPNQNLGLSMLQHEFIIAIRIWLGITVSGFS